MKNNCIVYFLLSISVFLSISFNGQAQCTFKVDTVEVIESFCQSSGIVKVTLTGEGVNNGNIQLPDAQYLIASTSGGYSTSFSANGGVLVNIPPGTYTITARAYCKSIAGWVYGVSEKVTVIGSYTVPNLNKIYVVTANIQKSLKCAATGSIPVKVEGGRAPYSITILTAPAQYNGPMKFDSIPEGVYTILGLSAGDYTFSLRDDCTYTLPLKAKVGEITPAFSVKPIADSRRCVSEGQIKFSAKDGLEPYSIIITKAPTGFPVPDTIIMPKSGTDTIKNLPAGSYTIVIKDSCGYSKTFTPKINEILPEAKSKIINQTVSCDNSGVVEIDIQNGVPNYTIKLVSTTSTYPIPPPFTQDHSGIFRLDSLPKGEYNFEITDNCGYNFTVSAIIEVDKLKMTGLTTTKSQSCKSTGSISFNLGGGQEPYKIEVTDAAAGYSKGLLFNPVNKGKFKLDSIPAGKYSFDIIDKCNDTLTIPVVVDTVKLDVNITVLSNSFHCLATGKFSIDIRGGVPPYLVIIKDAPLAYTPVPDTFYMDKPGKLPVDSLPDGSYVIVVIDSCGIEKTADISKTNIITYSRDIPEDPFYEYFYPPTIADVGCHNVRVKRKDVGNEFLGGYWNTNSSKFYEVKFSFNGTGAPTPWMPLDEFIDYSLPKTYKQVRTNKDFLVATVRLKNDSICAIPVNDTIWLNVVESIIDAPHSPSCDGFSFSFKQNIDDKGVFCYPYRWELRDSTNKVVKFGDNVDTSDTQIVDSILPFGTLTLHFKDKEGFEWGGDTVAYYWKNTSVATITYKDFTCADYSIEFVDPNICRPYSWIVRKPDNSVFAWRNGITVTDKQTVPHLKYNVPYKLYLIDNNKDTTEYAINHDESYVYNYKIMSGAEKCLPDIGKGYIKIYRNGVSTDSIFTIGTRIKYISGPSTPKHADIVLEGNQTNLTAIYPFSHDTIVNLQLEDIKQGIYKFEIIDTCGIVHPVQINYESYRAGNFTYSKKETCDGAEIYPTGEIYLGNTPQTAYFRIRSAPPGIAVSYTAITVGDFIVLPESGEYVIQMSAENGVASCPLDTLTIIYSKKSVELDRDATKAYICDDGSPGYIYVRAINGVGPYSYDLIDNKVDVASSTTGIFQYGVAGATYNIRINDIGCPGVSFEQGITMVDLSKERLIYGTDDVCIGDRIHLNCVPISPTYQWSGPNNYASNLQNPFIDSAKLDMTGIYTVTIQPEGCLKTIQQDIEVTIHQPDMPEGDDVDIQCLGSPSAPLTASVLPGHRLQWYDTDGKTKLPNAPRPSTVKVDTLTYYVTQISNDMNCESDLRAITAIINDLPDVVTEPKSPDICPGMYPVVVIPIAFENYTYNVYTSFSGGQFVGTGVGVGDTLKIQTDAAMMASTTYYIETLNENMCRGLERTPVNINVIDYVYIKPDAIPPYEREIVYRVELETNATPPYVFTALVSLPLGFDLSVDGVISGTAPRNGKIDPKPFTVKVLDANGCVAVAEYELKSDVFAPQVFTPNNDGVNDHFMKGKRLLIFDRLGVKIFEGTDGWDGTRHGKPAPADTYFYIIFHVNDEGENSHRTGYITLLRRQ